MKELTLIHAHDDNQHAQDITRQLLHATRGQLRVYANDDDSSARSLPQAWQKRLGSSYLFVILVSADLTNDPCYDMVQDVVRLHPDRLLFVYLRPCYLDSGTIEGHHVFPAKPITSYTGAAKEEAWLSVVQMVINQLSQVTDPQGYHELVPTFTREPEYTPHRKFAPRRENTPIVEHPLVHAPVPRTFTVAILSAPQDKAWVEPMVRTLKIIQRTNHSLQMVIEQNPTRDTILEATLTLALISPDFFASDQYHLYDELRGVMSTGNKPIIPVMLRSCPWENGIVYIPRSGPVKRIGNDVAWLEVGNKIRDILNQR